MRTALVISGGGFQGLGIVRALQQLNNVRVIVCDIHQENLVRYVCHDGIVAPPLSDETAFADFLCETIRHERVDVIFPATAYELPILSRLRDTLTALGATTAVASESLTITLLDKLHTHQFLCAANLPMPELLDPSAYDYAGPLFGRPRKGWGGRGTIVLRSRDEACAYDGNLSDYVWSPWLSTFDEYSADFAIGQHGDISPVVLRRRLRTSGGFAVISESSQDPVLADLAERIAAAIAAAKGCGIYNVQLIAPPAGATFVSDVNPRMGTSATHALAEGINLPGFFMACGGGPTADVPSSRRMVRTVRVLQDIAIPKLGRLPQGIVFDLDDTLVNHKQWMLRKLELVYPLVFSDLVDKPTYLMGAAQLIDEGERALLIDRLLHLLVLPENLRSRAIDAYRTAVPPETPVFGDVAPTLRALKAAGLPLAILTDNPPGTQRTKIRHARALDCVDATVCTREHGGEKPNPAAFLQAAQALQVDPANLVMIGDNYFRDGVGAIRAGYMHALILRRNGTFLSPYDGFTSIVPTELGNRIDVLDSLLSARHACLSP